MYSVVWTPPNLKRFAENFGARRRIDKTPEPALLFPPARGQCVCLEWHCCTHDLPHWVGRGTESAMVFVRKFSMP
jgi:hypothetical protein